jgi:hypothetical protein
MTDGHPKRPRDPTSSLTKSIIEIADPGAAPILHARVNLGTAFPDLVEPEEFQVPVTDQRRRAISGGVMLSRKGPPN